MTIGFAFVVLLSLLLSTIAQGPEEDRVVRLPGLDPQLTYNHYAGYLSVSDTTQYFYWFVPSERDSTNDPVVVWLNGGPGCSSLNGMMFENGPWKANPDGSGNLLRNEYRWNKIANMLYWDSPQCAGFSYGDNCSTNNEMAARNNRLALRSFFVKFPEYRKNDLLLTGQSYGGIYVPMLAALIEDDDDINFKGFAVGNGVTDFVTMFRGFPFFGYAHGLFGTELWNNFLEHCCTDMNVKSCRVQSERCDEVVRETNKVLWTSGLNPYNIYAKCDGGVADIDVSDIIEETDDEIIVARHLMMYRSPRHRDVVAEITRRSAAEGKKVMGRYPCLNTSHTEEYLNRQDVRAALHVSENADVWQAINRRVDFDLDMSKNVRQEYRKVLRKDHRILAYYGDVDMACDSLTGRWYMESLGLRVVEPLKKWYYEDTESNQQVAGFVEQFKGVTYVTVKGAGHLVPMEKPQLAYTVFEKFINREPY